MTDEATPRQIALEIAIYALAVLLVGGAFVAVRVAREGTRVLDANPRAGAPDRPSPLPPSPLKPLAPPDRK